MSIYDKNQNYLNVISGLDDETITKMMEDGAMTPVILVNISTTLATIADTLISIDRKLGKGEPDEGNQSASGDEP